MNTLLQSQIFFFISSIGFVVLWILVAILLFYLIHSVHVFSRIINKLEKDTDKIGDMAKDLLEEIKDSTVFSFLFKKKKRHRKN